MNEVVVGVDLYQSARAAVTWVAVQARAMRQTLQAVHAVGGSPALSRTLGMSGVPVPIAVSEIDAVHREAVAAVFDSIQPEPGWQLEFFAGDAGPALVAESVGAALLVVGTKDHVGIGRIVSGSVSHYCLSHPSARWSQFQPHPTMPRIRIMMTQQPTPRLIPNVTRWRPQNSGRKTCEPTTSGSTRVGWPLLRSK